MIYVPFDLGKWQMITITFDGKTIAIYKNGKQIKKQNASLSNAEPIVQIAPKSPWGSKHPDNTFNGKVANLMISKGVLSQKEITELLKQFPVNK